MLVKRFGERGGISDGTKMEVRTLIELRLSTTYQLRRPW